MAVRAIRFLYAIVRVPDLALAPLHRMLRGPGTPSIDHRPAGAYDAMRAGSR